MRASQEEKTIARVLHAFGASYADIAKLLLRPTVTVTFWCDKAKAQASKKRAKALAKEKRDVGLKVISPESRQRGRLRSLARIQAEESGEPVEEIYKRWGVVSKYSRRVY